MNKIYFIFSLFVSELIIYSFKYQLSYKILFNSNKQIK